MLKKLFFIILALKLSVPALADYAEVDGIGYYFNGDEAKVASKSDKKIRNVVIPSTVTYDNKTYRVTSINDKVFYYDTYLTTITIGNNVTSIKERAFGGCYNLTSVTLGNSITSIGEEAFSGCWDLTSINIPSSVTSIGEEAFYGCSKLTSLNIPSSVTSIGESAFSGCSSLTSTNIPSSVTSIGKSTFYGCSSLTSINIPSNVTSIGESAFSGCSSLTSINIPSSVIFIKNNAFLNCVRLTSISMPYYANYIGESAFYGCSALTSITIPNNVKSISKSAFYGCSSLTSINIPSSVTSIEESAFYGCSALTSITIPNNVTSIGKSAFYGCRGLASITIPNRVTSIEDSVFFCCKGLTTINIPNNVTSIGNSAFYGCSALTSITIPNRVTSIGNQAFFDCTGLETITIPNSVTSIGERVFAYCSALTSINMPNNVTSIGKRAFYECTGLASITIPNSVTSIEESTFYGCKDLASITIPNNVTSIGNSAFYGCSALTSITIPNSVTSIEEIAFGGCTSLTSVTVKNETPLTITENVFPYKVKVNANLYVPVGTKTAYQAANYWKQFRAIFEPVIFSNNPDGNTCSVTGYTDACTGNVTIPSSVDGRLVTSIGMGAFAGCTGLEAITIPNSVTSIGESAFSGCSNLTSVTVNTKTPLTITNDVFTKRTNSKLYVPAGSKAAYEAADYWKEFKEIKEIGMTSPTGITGLIYTGSAQDLIKAGASNMRYSLDGTNYGTTIPQGTDAKEYTVYYKVEGNESVSTIKVTISPKTVSSPTISLSQTSYTYDGTAKEPTVTVKDGETTISAEEYTVGYSNNTNVGTATVTITDKTGGNYAVSGSKTFTINTKTVSSPTITLSQTSYTYDGTAKEPTVTVKDGETTISAEEYTVGYSNNTNVGTATVTITDKTGGNYAVSGSKTFTINTKTVSSPTITLSQTSYTYDGTAKEPTVTVKDGETTISAEEYTVGYSNNTNAGTATVTITDKEGGNYNVSGSTTFAIVEAGELAKFVYSINPDEITCTITGYTDACTGNVTIPSSIDGRSVTSIGENAFLNCSALSSISIPNSVTSIGHQAFRGCSNLTSIELPDEVSEIGNYAFYGCSSLSEFTIPGSLKKMGNNWDNCYTFGDCMSLKKITINKGAKLIGLGAIKNLPIETVIVYNTEPIRVYENFKAIIRDAATLYVPSGCSSAYKEADGWSFFTNVVEMDADVDYSDMGKTFTVDGINYKVSSISPLEVQVGWWRAGAIDKNYEGSLTIPSSVTGPGGKVYSCTSIGYMSFSSRSGLTSITIPNSVTNINKYAFQSCSNLTSVTVEVKIPLPITEDVFSNRANATLYVPAGSKTAYEAADYWKEFNEIIEMEAQTGNIVFANDKVKAACVANWDTDEDGELSYAEAAAVTRLIENSNAPFAQLLLDPEFTSFDEFQYFTGITNLFGYEFGDCKNLTSIKLPNSITSIGFGAFRNCPLTSIHIPASVTNINMGNSYKNTFNSQYLQAITVDPENTKYASPEGSNAIIESIDEEHKTLILGCGNTDFTKLEGVTTIGDQAFQFAVFPESKTSIILPTTVTEILYGAFSDSNITSINLGALTRLTTLGDFAFTGCKGLTEVTIPASITNRSESLNGVGMGECVFYDCINIVKVVSEIEEPFEISQDLSHDFNFCTNNAVLYVPKDKVQDYIDNGWEEIDNYLKIQSFRVITHGNSTDPEAIGGLTYNGKDQKLILPGTYRNGMMEYSLDGTNYSTSVPLGKDAGEYTVYYRKVGESDASILKVTIAAPKTISVFSGSNLWAGYVATEDLALPTGLEAYVITNLGATTATASSLNYIPQGVPVLLKRNNASVNDYEISTGSGTAPTVNLLKTYDSDKSVSNREGFILYNDEFVLVNEGTLPAGRVFLPANKSGVALTRGIVTEGDDTTGIYNSKMDFDDSDKQWYDLQGRKLERKPTKKGIYILDGRKVVIK